MALDPLGPWSVCALRRTSVAEIIGENVPTDAYCNTPGTNNMDWSAITGWSGALLVLAGFYLTVVKDWKPESGRYMVLSNVAAALLVANATMNSAYPFLVVNIALIVVTGYTLLKNGLPPWH